MLLQCFLVLMNTACKYRLADYTGSSNNNLNQNSTILLWDPWFGIDDIQSDKLFGHVCETEFSPAGHALLISSNLQVRFVLRPTVYFHKYYNGPELTTVCTKFNSFLPGLHVSTAIQASLFPSCCCQLPSLALLCPGVVHAWYVRSKRGLHLHPVSCR